MEVVASKPGIEGLAVILSLDSVMVSMSVHISYRATVAHHRAGLTHLAKLFGQPQQSDFGADDLLFGRRRSRCARAPGP
jgi:hypothetical protein